MLPIARLNLYISPYVKQIDEEISSLTSYNFIQNIVKNVAFGGKRVRPIVLILLSNLLGGREREAFINASVSIELIHIASLLHDDVIDAGKIRHGKPSAHLFLGNQQVILGGDYLFAESFKQIVKTQNLKVISVISDVSSVLASGELQQLQAKINHNTNFDEYLEIIYKKTASLFEASAKIAAIIQDTEYGEIAEFGRKIGMAFQIIDDVLDYTSNKTGKILGTDFFEGKITLPVILACENLENKLILEGLFAKSIKTKDDLQKVIDILTKSATLDRAKKIALNYALQAKTSINYNTKESELIFELIDFFLSRLA
jgi:octaprenyl-diphosphate synthase